MTKHLFIPATVLLMLIQSCHVTGNAPEVINLEQTGPRRITVDWWEQHQVLENTGQSDTLELQGGLLSVIRPQYLVRAASDYESDIVYSRHSILLREKLLYTRDSILGAGPFSTSHKDTFIGFPVVLSQNQDSGVTISDMILLDKYKNQSTIIAKSVDNNANPFFSFDDSKLFFLDGDSLFCYQIDTKKTTEIVAFESFNGLFLYMQPVSPTTFKIFYLETLESGDIYETEISTTKPYFR